MAQATKVRVWDIPTRIFHWTLVFLVFFCWLTQEKGWMELHFLAGEAILALVLFRIAWGFAGSQTSRFASFLKHPMEALHHLKDLRKREPDTELGHNAAGGWMVLGLLGLLLLQVASGMFANDDASFVEGPLRHLVSKGISDFSGKVHELSFALMQIAVLLHIAAIVVYLALKGHNLVRPMILGTKDIAGPVTQPTMVGPMRGLVVFALAAAAVTALVRYL
jgi:cytochrome b